MYPRSRLSLALSFSIVLSLLGAAAANSAAQSSSSSSNQSSSSSGPSGGESYAREKSPTSIDPAGPTISLTSAEPVFAMAAALNVCGYDEGLAQSAPIRQHIRDEINQALAKNEDARKSRDALCLYVAQHRMTGTAQDIAQYISLSLYVTPPPALELAADLTEMPPDATQVAEVLPLLRDFAVAVDLHGIWLAGHHAYDEEAAKLHDALSQMIVDTNVYLKMPAAVFNGTRFIVLIEPQLGPAMVNARIYGTDYIVVVSPANGKIPMSAVRHTYLHYVIDPMLYSRSNAMEREQPILKAIREAPLAFRFRSDPTALNVECLIKAIEARTTDTGIPAYKIPAGVDRSQLPRYEHEKELSQQKAEAVRTAAVDHDMRQGYVLTKYFYEQLLQFEKSPVSLKDSMGELVYGVDVDQETHRAKQTQFDAQADEELLQRPKPRQLTGLDLAEQDLSAGNVAAASALAQKVLASEVDTVASTADAARAHFILARVDLLRVHPGLSEDEAEQTIGQAVSEFQKTLETSKDQRLLAWSHIYLGRVLDLECKRDEAVAEYQAALAVRDGRLDTRLAAERGEKTAYAVKGHGCDEGDDAPDGGAAKPVPQAGAPKP